MKKIIFSLGIFFLLINTLVGSTPQNDKKFTKEEVTIEWISLAEAYERMQQDPRKIIVDVYTNWCGWCKRMDRETFSNEEVAQYVNEHFYAVKLNAESKDEELILGESMTHQMIARQFQVRGYPTIVVVNEDFKTFTPYPGYKDAKSFMKMLKALKEKNG